MGLKVAAPLNPQHLLPHTFASSKPTSGCRQKCTKKDQRVVCGFIIPSSCTSMKVLKTGSFYKPISRGQTIKRSCSMSFDDLFHEDVSEEADDLVQCVEMPPKKREDGEKRDNNSLETSLLPSKLETLEPYMLGIKPEFPKWPEREELMRMRLERKVNSFDLPLSLRMIQKKHQCQESFQPSGEKSDTDCPVQIAFSTMVSIILELQSHELKMRQVISDQDLEKVIGRVHKEMHISFAWLFQQVFCQTPSLMMDVMELLAEFSTYSLSQIISTQHEFDKNVTKSHTGNTEHDNKSVRGITYMCRSSDSLQCFGSTAQDTSFLCLNEHSTLSENEKSLLKSMMDEAAKAETESGCDVVDKETVHSFISPISFEKDEYMELFRTDLLYQMGLAQDPNNSLLLCNYAQFLYLIVGDYDRAEECFKRAIHVHPIDAEAFGQYAYFLWEVRKDLWAAEERYLQALAAEPENMYRVSAYANFLWSTGGEETCFPIDTSNGKCC